jgi:hypothetical protein
MDVFQKWWIGTVSCNAKERRSAVQDNRPIDELDVAVILQRTAACTVTAVYIEEYI